MNSIFSIYISKLIALALELLLCFLLYTYFSAELLHAQNSTSDSLKFALKNAKNDTTYCKLLAELIEDESNPNIWIEYNKQLKTIIDHNLNLKQSKKDKELYTQYLSYYYNNLGFYYDNTGNSKAAEENYIIALDLKRKVNDYEGIATCYNNLAAVYHVRGDNLRAINNFKLALEMQKKLNDLKGLGRSLNNLGYMYSNLGDINAALNYYFEALKIQESTGNLNGQALSFSNIGLIYQSQGSQEKALECFNKSYELYKKTGDLKGQALALHNLAFAASKNRDPSRALNLYIKSIALRKELGDVDGASYSYNNIATMFSEQKQNDSALKYLYLSLNTTNKVGNKDLGSQIRYNIGYILNEQKQTEKAFLLAKESLKLGEEIGSPDRIKFASSLLSTIYRQKGDYKNALLMYEKCILMRDSVSNLQTKKASLKKQFQYQYEKKAAADSVKNAEEQKVHDALLEAQSAQLKQERIQRFALFSGLLFVIVFSSFVFNRYKVTQKQKKIIEVQKQQVDFAYEKLHEKNKEVMDSIRYAARIQRSLITSEKYIASRLKRLNKQ